MSEIYFFRHGQASFGEENYDRLSALGVRQAKVLARYLVKAGKVFDAVYYGEMERQQKTALEIVNHYHQKKLPAPRPEVLDAFNEYDSFAIWQALIPEMIEEQPSLSKELDKLPGDQKVFQRVFSQVMVRWAKGEYSASGIPRWDNFVRRVNLGIEKLTTRHGAQQRLAVFTSGGPISVTVKAALGLSDKMTLEISWQLMNASITRIKYNSKGIMLAGFNEVSHLELEGDVRLLTYR
jgi:broad specificity phosphatase PhoE